MTDITPQPRASGRLADLMVDAAGIAGAVLITYGVSLVYRPAAFIVAGVFLLGGAWLAARRGA